MVCSICKGKKDNSIENIYSKIKQLIIVKELSLVTVIIMLLIPVAFAQEFPELGVKVETVADKLTIPWAIDWASDEKIFFTERNGNLRVIENGILVQETVAVIKCRRR